MIAPHLCYGMIAPHLCYGMIAPHLCYGISFKICSIKVLITTAFESAEMPLTGDKIVSDCFV
jgi:hypothetical protein